MLVSSKVLIIRDQHQDLGILRGYRGLPITARSGTEHEHLACYYSQVAGYSKQD